MKLRKFVHPVVKLGLSTLLSCFVSLYCINTMISFGEAPAFIRAFFTASFWGNLHPSPLVLGILVPFLVVIIFLPFFNLLVSVLLRLLRLDPQTNYRRYSDYCMTALSKSKTPLQLDRPTPLRDRVRRVCMVCELLAETLFVFFFVLIRFEGSFLGCILAFGAVLLFGLVYLFIWMLNKACYDASNTRIYKCKKKAVTL